MATQTDLQRVRARHAGRRPMSWGWMVVAVATVGVLVNAVAWRQAMAMTTFVRGGNRTASPESLGFLHKVGVLLRGVRLPRPESTAAPAALGLPAETIRLEAGDGTRLEAWAIPCPDARGVVVLLHGYAACKDALLGEAAFFRAEGFHVLVPDFRGGGGSAGARTTIGVDEARDVVAADQAARSRWPGLPVVHYGVSMGAAAALRAVRLHDLHPDGLVLHAPFDRLLHTIRHRFRSMGLPAWPGAELLATWGSLHLGINAFRHNPVHDATAVRCPVLVLHGEFDPRVRPDEARAVAEAVPHGATFHLMPGAGHVSYLQATPDAFARAVRPWLDACVPR